MAGEWPAAGTPEPPGFLDQTKAALHKPLTWDFIAERVTGIEPALSAWEAGDAPWPATPVS